MLYIRKVIYNYSINNIFARKKYIIALSSFQRTKSERVNLSKPSKTSQNVVST